ncbi:MFS transporter [Sansalvadorimonas sp. 2012CJ34-2]|uniref:MFS transporter n=1 Tax=Parendozoicomonas callyspongiae TaxID=2942213 RepID=A0ABT0PHH6_9GAMM|nr:MFS transporter [Sansalvadorimonas sp. 2012CJ34-2]MCL6270830.1 MFS transporter [Sansalvadorimonas sp. 2012CJ34-2]
MDLSQLKSPKKAVSALFILNGALFGAWASRIPSLQTQFGLSEQDLGLYLLLLAGGAVISFPVAGVLSDRFGAVRVSRIATILYCISLPLIALAPNLLFLSLAIFLFGMAHGGLDVAMNTWGTEVEASLDKPVMSFFHAMFSVGAGSGAAFGGMTAWMGLNTLQHFVIFAILMVPILSFANVPWASKTVSKRESVGFRIPKGSLLIVALIAFSSALVEGAMADWSAVFLASEIQASVSAAAAGYTVFSILMVMMRLNGDWITRKLGPDSTVKLCGAFALIGSLVLILADTLFMSYLGFGFMGMGFAIIMPLVFSRAAQEGAALEDGGGAGASIAGVASFGYGGMLLGPPVIGFIAEYFSLRTAFSLFVAIGIAIIFSSSFFRRERTCCATAAG